MEKDGNKTPKDRREQDDRRKQEQDATYTGPDRRKHERRSTD